MNKILFPLLSVLILFFGASPLAAQLTKGKAVLEQEIPLPDELKEGDTGSSDSRFMSEFFNMLLVLVFIVVLLYAGSWMFRRMLTQRTMQMNETSKIKVLEHRSLSPKTALYIIHVFGKTMLISESQNGVKFLSELPEEQNLSE